MNLGESVMVKCHSCSGAMGMGEIVGKSDRFFSERRKGKRAVSDVYLIELNHSGRIVDNLRYDIRSN